MFAIAFDMVIADLKRHYGEPYNNAYYDISTTLFHYGFYRVQGSVYLSNNTDMVCLVRAIEALKNIDWFKNSLRDIRVFRVENWSDFTDFVKGE
jgi:virulence-associated protein VapD